MIVADYVDVFFRGAVTVKVSVQHTELLLAISIFMLIAYVKILVIWIGALNL